jgi:hypothetical protein
VEPLSAGGPGRLPLRSAARQHVQDFSDRPGTIGKFGYGQVVLDLVAIPPPLSLLEDVPGFGEIRDNGVRVSLCDAEVGPDLAQADIRILRDAQQCPAVVGEQGPVGHWTKVTEIMRKRLLVFEI